MRGIRTITGRIWPRSQTWRAALTIVFIAILITAALIAVDALFADAVRLKDIGGFLQSAVTVFAILVGGWFAYNKLQILREFEPHLSITHEVHHRRVGTGYMHLDITVTLYNSSKVSLALDEADFSVQQIAPVSDEEIEELYAQVFEDEDEIHLQWLTLDEAHHDWDIGEMVVEPGESHQETYEFIVPSPVETVLVYTYFRNPQHSRSSRSAEGWGATTVYDTIRNDR